MSASQGCFALRYFDRHGIDTIEDLMQLIKKLSYCWFEKIGKRFQKKYSIGLYNDKALVFIYQTATQSIKASSMLLPILGVQEAERFNRD